MEMFEYCPKVVPNLCKLCEFFIIPYFCLFLKFAKISNVFASSVL